ncbi:putative Glycosyl transferase family 1 domain-containing protein [Candidatus Magnetomoraceae bacterium gMMP-15]
MQHIIFWQNILSIHQLALIRALSDTSEYNIILVVEQELSKKRISLGWNRPDFGNCKIVCQPDKTAIKKLIDQNIKKTVHIFSGIQAYPMVHEAFKQAIDKDLTIGIYAETGNWLGIKGKLRLLRSRLYALCYSRKITFMLAVGHLGVRWLQMSGCPEHRIYPFGYFVEKPYKMDTYGQMKALADTSVIKLVFIGQCIKKKGLDTLLQALSTLKHLSWHLKIIGNGKNKEYFQLLSKKLGMSKYIDFFGALPNEQAIDILSKNDLLVLPSRSKDGWGAVVNEALMLGIPVICSNYCGAADLLSESWRGEIFKAGSVESLRTVLKKWILKGPINSTQRLKIKEWSEFITGESAARYLIEIIKHSTQNQGIKPTPPWINLS